MVSSIVGLVFINLQPEYELRSSICFGQFQKFRKNESRALSSPATSKDTILHGFRVLVRGYLCVRFDIPSYINFKDINSLPKFGSTALIRGHP